MPAGPISNCCAYRCGLVKKTHDTLTLRRYREAVKNRMWTVDEIAAEIGRQPRQVQRLAAVGRIPGARLSSDGYHREYPDSPELRKWIAARQAKAGPPARSAAARALVILRNRKLDDTGRRMWTQMGNKLHLSAAELTESIRLGRPVRFQPPPKTQSAGVSSFEGFSVRWGLLRRQIDEVWKEWNEDDVAEARAFLKPIEDFLAELDEQFGSPKKKNGASARRPAYAHPPSARRPSQPGRHRRNGPSKQRSS